MDLAFATPVAAHYVVTPLDRRWKRYRLAYYAALLTFVIVVGWQAGPNLILFRSVFAPTPAKLAELTHEHDAIIAAIKAYQRDFNKLPLSNYDLPPHYLPSNYNGDNGNVYETTSITFVSRYGSVLEYEFSPANEGWYIHSPRYDGRLPTPIIPAAARPTTAVTTLPAHANPE